ncbi:uncharacterized protein LOC142974325 isoform X2 [Anticarsia gemmatalis]|uniref:uncharacterized protein LOC142974325 isoform X2 n=1 Tax=Anticarsia gemmatalis TaxID=129554 RepID=UPI003F7778AB
MACIENITPMNVDSEMEEGEIVDDLSDISSEEEFLLRQRLEVLESYNNVLERKKAKRSSVAPGSKHKKEDALSYDLSEISATDLEDYCSTYKNIKVQKPIKTHHRQKRKKEEQNDVVKAREYRKKNTRQKKKLEVKIISASSEESDDEYRSRRKKLADAVVVNKTKNDKTSLSERLQKMLRGVNPQPMKLIIAENKKNDVSTKVVSPPNCSPISSQNTDDHILNGELQNGVQETTITCEIIDICTDDDSKTAVNSVDTVDSVAKDKVCNGEVNKVLDRDKSSEKDSDDDLELLRQHALKTKTVNNKVPEEVVVPSENKPMSEDEDSDTTELRLICLKSTYLKKAIEKKRKEKLQKKLSQSANLEDECVNQIMLVDKINSDNNTDIESVDMDIGSDGDDKLKENDDCTKSATNQGGEKNIPVLMVSNEDELEEDEDLLRAKLLTSLSKNLPHLVNPSVIKTVDSVKDTGQAKPKPPPQPAVIPEEKRFIINVESDSEGEHEATKNLTKMHMKLSEQVDFQQKLDMFLKSTRMEVEKTTLPDVVQPQTTPKKKEKYVAKAVKNLPKSEQIEYRNLVKRMAELEKIKQARQTSIGLNKVPNPLKDTLKPRNVTIDTTGLSTINSLEEKIKNSRKNIAQESAKMLKLKEEGVKLSQKFKIVATELRNIKTAITLNKKQQRSVQNYLTKIRLDHQLLLKSSLTSTHSKTNVMSHLNHTNIRLQKENNPKEPVPLKENPKEDYKNPVMLKAVKIGVVNDLKPKPVVVNHPRLSVEIQVSNNMKVVKIPDKVDQPDKSDQNKSKSEESNKSTDLPENKRQSSNPVVEKGGGNTAMPDHKRRKSDDYKSPLDAFGSTTWEEDPNAILCPFEVFGDCKDTDCKYLHTKTRSK